MPGEGRREGLGDNLLVTVSHSSGQVRVTESDQGQTNLTVLGPS